MTLNKLASAESEGRHLMSIFYAIFFEFAPVHFLLQHVILRQRWSLEDSDGEVGRGMNVACSLLTARSLRTTKLLFDIQQERDISNHHLPSWAGIEGGREGGTERKRKCEGFDRRESKRGRAAPARSLPAEKVICCMKMNLRCPTWALLVGKKENHPRTPPTANRCLPFLLAKIQRQEMETAEIPGKLDSALKAICKQDGAKCWLWIARVKFQSADLSHFLCLCVIRCSASQSPKFRDREVGT